ncbi:M1 family aminopeptidase [Chitinophagaceae bacterium LB-8]|uniref:Aminopeptidase N n=1 Tax=Paraflavisolibacter caeni TaxID=2982496 RepID=A0A9X2Y1B5_9BACT|nr:M1 family aminopeptidase [Paraflavisolibacter caeni]MCU7552717.1 M1 family aminopeptidase [Paraflavisolibacter caeni]
MKRLVFFSFYCLMASVLTAQETKADSTAINVYRATAVKINDLVHTKLDAKFDYSKSQLIGKVWISLKPHFYPTDSLLLDAKGMDIRQIAIVKGGKNVPLKYKYDGMQLNIDLDKTYRGGDVYTIYIDYTAKPDELKVKGSAAITNAKGLYFINPRGEEKNKPTQIWTQGETEATSVYVPTIDKPNQKTTQEFILTVPSKYVTLSNGKLISQKSNTDGTRTDYWKMDKPHAPYLFFIGVGDYAIVKDSYKGKEVNYYVEKEYAPVAKKIFGNTPEMMKFFSNITGVEYPWNKYSQIVGRDYVSGAMENTTATLHQESAQQDARELIDGNHWEDVIAHELFHQWFGDLVTTESWSNLTLNESFANYSEYLWNEYKYGKDAADEHNLTEMQGYLGSGSEKKDLVRFHYRDKEDMFDAVSYNKGGRILNMLRNYVGDSAFFKAMNLYLTTNQYKSAEAHQLRLAFEEITGKDLNWFWNQWYFGAGHPKLDINYYYNEQSKQAQVIVKQTQASENPFILPVAIDIYSGNDRVRHNVFVQNRVDTFSFASATKPDLINFDAEKVLLAEKKENKTLTEYLYQYKHARNYMDRREAIDAAAKNQADPKATEIMLDGLQDKFHGLRSYVIGKLDLKNNTLKERAESTLARLAEKDEKSTVRAAAIARLGEYNVTKYSTLLRNAVNDSSYSVSGNALNVLSHIDSKQAYDEAKRLAQGKIKGDLAEAVTSIMIQAGDESSANVILSNFEDMPLSQAKLEAVQPLAQYLVKLKSDEDFKRGVDAIMELSDQIPEAYKGQIVPYIETLLQNVQKAKTAAGQSSQAGYVDGKLKKKGM